MVERESNLLFPHLGQYKGARLYTRRRSSPRLKMLRDAMRDEVACKLKTIFAVAQNDCLNPYAQHPYNVPLFFVL